jgi:hypothetical protein
LGVAAAVLRRSARATPPSSKPSIARQRPGPARLVASVADLLALLLGARLVLRFPGVAAFAAPVAAVVELIVDPFQLLAPALRVGGGVLELYTLAGPGRRLHARV